MKHFGLVCFLVFLVAATSFAGEVPEWVEKTKISGLMFGDSYWMAANHDEEIEGANGFWFRRIYLTLDWELSENWDSRLRFEANSDGDFETSTTIDPFLKDAYLRWKGDQHSVYLGLSGTPTWGVVEKVWDYRSVEKTPLDLQRLGGSRDIGVALRGSLGSAKKFRYHLMGGNGASNKTETNEGKKAMFSLGYYPTESLILEVYGDFDQRPGSTDRATYQAFAYYKGNWGYLGLQGARQRREVEGGEALDLDIASIFSVFHVNDKTKILARYDKMFDPNPDGAEIDYLPFDPTAKSNLVILGVDRALLKGINLIPNIEYVFYEGINGAPDPDDDLIVRLTFFWKF